MPDEQIARWEGIGLVRLSLETLDDRSRELVRLKFNEDLSYKEISARTGLNIGHVGYLLHHALKAIADELRQKWSSAMKPRVEIRSPRAEGRRKPEIRMPKSEGWSLDMVCNPKGIESFSPGLRGTSYPGFTRRNIPQPWPERFHPFRMTANLPRV